MKNRGVSSLLIFLEIAVLVVVVVLGIVKFIGKDKTPSGEKPVVNQEQDTEEGSDHIGEVNVEPEQFSEEIQQKLDAMTLEEKVAQLFLVSPETLTGNDVVTLAGNGTRRALTEYPVGGLVYSDKNLLGSQQFVSLLNGAQNHNQNVNESYLFLAATTEAEGRDTGLVLSQETGGESMLTAMLADLQGDLPETITPAEITEKSVSETIFLLTWNDLYITTNLSESEVLEAYPDGEGAVQSILTGADLLYTTDNFETMYQAVLTAVENGDISNILVDNAVGHILTVKDGLQITPVAPSTPTTPEQTPVTPEQTPTAPEQTPTNPEQVPPQ